MDTDSLFKTRQLTEYRKWPNGKEGCLFYVAEHESFRVPDTIVAIILVDTPCRKYDEVGDFDNLHKAELLAIRPQNYIIEGFGAVLFANNDNWDEGLLWREYLEFIEEKASAPKSFFTNIISECSSWLKRKKKILDILTDGHNGGRDFSFAQIMLGEISGFCSSTMKMMWIMQPSIFLASEGEERTHYIWCEPLYSTLEKSFRKAENDECTLVGGFLAMFVNYMASSVSYKRFIIQACRDSDDMAQAMTDIWGHNNIKNRVLSLFIKDIDFSKVETDFQEIFDSYINPKIRDIMENNKYDPSRLKYTTQERKQYYYKTLLKEELDLYAPDNALFQYCSEEQIKILQGYMHNFFLYISTFFRGDKEEAALLKRINDKYGIQSKETVRIIDQSLQQTDTPIELWEYIDVNELQRKGIAPEEYERQLRKMVDNNAHVFSDFLKAGVAEGKLHFKGDGAKQIFYSMVDHFKDRKSTYKYSNFSSYFSPPKK